MPTSSDEVAKREKDARTAIRGLYGTEKDEFGATLFVSHHLEEVESKYWQSHLGTDKPEPLRVLDILTLRSHWGKDDAGIDVFDFTLPDEVTPYVISVHFDGDGMVDKISMES